MVASICAWVKFLNLILEAAVVLRNDIRSLKYIFFGVALKILSSGILGRVCTTQLLFLLGTLVEMG